MSFEPGYLVAKMCVNYAKKIIIDKPYNFRWNDDRFTGAIGPIGGGGTMPVSRVETVYTDWSITSQKRPMLSNYKYWKQGSPFNDLYPLRRAWIFTSWKKAPAGCFPLAIAKIMAYFQFPRFLTNDSYTIDWESVNDTADSHSGRMNKARLLFLIAEGCHCWYFWNGTFTFPKKAIRFLRQKTFQNVESLSYNTADAIKMIDKGYPTIVYGIPGINIINSHAWNIDGYKIQQRKRTTTYYNGSNVVKRESEEEIQKWFTVILGGVVNAMVISVVTSLISTIQTIQNLITTKIMITTKVISVIIFTFSSIPYPFN